MVKCLGMRLRVLSPGLTLKEEERGGEEQRKAYSSIKTIRKILQKETYS